MKYRAVDTLNHYEILAMSPCARPEEIERAYLHVTSIYCAGSVASYGALTGDEREWMIKRIQRAYEVLMNQTLKAEYDRNTMGLDDEAMEKMRLNKESDKKKIVPPNGVATMMSTGISQPKENITNTNGDGDAINLSARRITGSHLRNIRIAKGSTLDDISHTTKVKKSYLEAIEEEDIQKFPAPIFMRGFIKAYAKALGLHPEEITEKYMADK